MKENNQPKFNLELDNTLLRTRKIVSEDNVVYDKRKIGNGREILVARGGDIFSRPVFKNPEGSALRKPPPDIENVG